MTTEFDEHPPGAEILLKVETDGSLTVVVEPDEGPKIRGRFPVETMVPIAQKILARHGHVSAIAKQDVENLIRSLDDPNLGEA